MNLALLDIRRNFGRFAGTSLGIALLFTVVLAMAGIYRGLVDDATILLRTLNADLWVVQKDTHGPFADASRIDPSVEQRVAAAPGARRARAFTYQIVERVLQRRPLRFALVGLSWPDVATNLPIVAGRGLAQAHGELVADVSLGLHVGDAVSLANEEYKVVGLVRQVLGSGGDGVIIATLADSVAVLNDAPNDALRTERERRIERLRHTDLGRATPGLELLLADPRWQPPVLAPPPIAAVLVNVDSPTRLAEMRASLDAWPDVAATTTADQEKLLLDGVVDKPRRQLGLFGLILVVTSSILIAAVVYMMTLDKTRDIAMLKLIGAPPWRIAGMVLQQAWLMGAVGFAIAVAVGSQAFPHFPRRVVLTPESIAAVGILVLAVSTLGSLLGVGYALRVDAGKALEGLWKGSTQNT